MRRTRTPRALLFYPPQNCLERSLRLWSFSHGTNFPLALLRLSTRLKERGHEVDYLDTFNVYDDSPASIARAVRPDRVVRELPYGHDAGGPRPTRPVYHVGMTWDEIDARLAGLKPPDEIHISSIFTWSWETTHRSVALLRRRFPKARIALGGIYPTLCPEKAAETGAEIHRGVLPELEDAWLDADLLATVPGIEGFVLKTSIGCPHRCSYCAVHELEGRRVTFRDPADVLDEFDALTSRLPLKRMYFWESNILLRAPRHIVKILEGIAARGSPLTLLAPEGLQPSLITPALAGLMKRAGLRELRITLETTDVVRLKDSRRPTGLRQVERALAVLEGAGYPRNEIAVVLLVGQPGQTTRGILRDIVRVSAMGVKASFLAYTPIPGTADFAHYARQIGDRPLETLDSFLYPMAHAGMTAAELDAVFAGYHERLIPLASIAGGATGPRLIARMHEMLRAGETPAPGVPR